MRVITRLTRNKIADDRVYAYDNLHRLTSVTYPGGPADTYTYDAVGNRVSKNGGATTYTGACRERSRGDDADQMLTAGGVSYAYDANGNTRGGAGAGSMAISASFNCWKGSSSETVSLRTPKGAPPNPSYPPQSPTFVHSSASAASN